MATSRGGALMTCGDLLRELSVALGPGPMGWRVLFAEEMRRQQGVLAANEAMASPQMYSLYARANAHFAFGSESVIAGSRHLSHCHHRRRSSPPA
ncbi:uncharacterized protein VTP21DRAFT_3028 [Calcarisporiella thermophila]|uniref:uncharacterized protein n=1 Tax=Calcarisporiella thermophila TaxID=911321 RepID=UPI0037429C33